MVFLFKSEYNYLMLRYTVTILLILFAITNISYSQFNVGISGEVTSSKFGGVAPDKASYESIAGFGGSLIGEIRLVKDVYLSLQPGFQTQGSNIKFGNENSVFNDTTVTFKISQSYLNIPLNLKIFRKNFYVGAGFAVGFLSSAEISNEYVDSTIDIKDKFKSTDITANFNVGYQMSIGKPYLFFELRYIQGLININNVNDVTSKDIYIADFKTKGFSFQTGIILPLK